jgi:hypothetical protein
MPFVRQIDQVVVATTINVSGNASVGALEVINDINVAGKATIGSLEITDGFIVNGEIVTIDNLVQGGGNTFSNGIILPDKDSQGSWKILVSGPDVLGNDSLVIKKGNTPLLTITNDYTAPIIDNTTEVLTIGIPMHINNTLTVNSTITIGTTTITESQLKKLLLLLLSE